ncbi:MAG TPA: hypothetical protein DCE41_15055 [Cytophagales bacterium]|nr:hypothetical protein [Cytophagales bacterium]
MKRIFLWSLGLCLSYMGYAQSGNNPWEDPRGIEDAEIVIEKKREIELPTANRQYNKVPPLPAPPAIAPFQYSFQEFTYGLAPLKPRVRPLTLSDEPLSKLYGNYVKAGFGNYVTPYAAAHLSNKRNPDVAWNAHLEHQSSLNGPVDSSNSGNARSLVALSTRTMGQKGSLRTTLGYERQMVHYYGYPETDIPPISDSIRQVYHRFGAEIAIRPNGERVKADYTLDARYNFQADRFGAQEQVGGLKGSLFLDINEDFSAELALAGYLSQRADLTEQFRYYAQLQPVVVYTRGDLEVKGGVNVIFDNDTLANTNPTYLYPVVQAKYTVTDALVPYAKLWGNVEMVTWHRLTQENPWIGREAALNNTVIPIEVILGAQGALGTIGYYDAGVSIGTVRNWYFYTLSDTETGRFDLEYDQNNTTRFNAFGEITAKGGEIFRGSLRADYYFYQRRDGLGEPLDAVYAWHRPQVSLTALTQVNLGDKFLLDAKASILGGIIVPGEAEALAPIYDLGVKAEYRVTQRLGVFANFSNLLNQNWVQYQNYPSQNLLFIGGVSYAF